MYFVYKNYVFSFIVNAYLIFKNTFKNHIIIFFYSVLNINTRLFFELENHFANTEIWIFYYKTRLGGHNCFKQ